MMWTLCALIVGIFLGWNLPQPIYAENLQDELVFWLKQKNIFK